MLNNFSARFMMVLQSSVEYGVLFWKVERYEIVQMPAWSMYSKREIFLNRPQRDS